MQFLPQGDGTSGFALRHWTRLKQRTLEARGEKPLVIDWTPSSPEAAEKAGVTDIDMKEAVEYYRTPRGEHKNADNRLRFRSIGSVLAFDAFHLVEELLTQPLQIIVGNRIGAFGSYMFGQELFKRATCKKDIFVVEGASHYDLYDRPQYVDQAVAKLEAFYKENLRH
jgi:fermentation-respiration switch protein FrsA (DUF1100 family)